MRFIAFVTLALWEAGVALTPSAVAASSLPESSAQFARERQMGGIGITVFADSDYRGRNATFRDDVPDLVRYDMNDVIGSLQVAPARHGRSASTRTTAGAARSSRATSQASDAGAGVISSRRCAVCRAAVAGVHRSTLRSNLRRTTGSRCSIGASSRETGAFSRGP